MLISSNGFFFLGALPPTQLMGLTGTGRAGDDTRRGLDPAQPPREDAWGRTASQLPGGEQSPARVLHTPQQGGVWAAPLVLDRPRSSPTSSHVAGMGAVCQHGAASVPCSTDPLRAVPLQVVLQQRCAFFPSLERFETLVGRYNKPENKLALPWGRPFYLVPFNGADNVLSSFCLHSLPFPFRREIFLVLVLLSPAGAMLKALHIPALSPLAFPLLPGLGGGLS